MVLWGWGRPVSRAAVCQDQGTCVRSSVVVGTVTSVRCDTDRAAPLGYIARCQASCTPGTRDLSSEYLEIINKQLIRQL